MVACLENQTTASHISRDSLHDCVKCILFLLNCTREELLATGLTCLFSGACLGKEVSIDFLSLQTLFMGGVFVLCI